MLLGFKTKFSNGEPTNFKEKILSGEKRHTIRLGDRWKPGMNIHFATGVRTRQCDIFKIYPCVSVQRIEMWSLGKGLSDHRKLVITIDGIDMYEELRLNVYGKPFFYKFISNDGFGDNAFQFYEWFRLHGTENIHFTGQLIHWTDLKY